MKEFVEWLKAGWEIVCKLFPWLLQGVAYLALTVMYCIILNVLYVFIFRKDATVDDMKKQRSNIEFIIILIVSLTLAILTIGVEIH